MTMINVSTKQPLADIANPFRSFDINPVVDDGAVVPSLVISIKKTGAWTKWMARAIDGKGNPVMDAGFYDDLDGSLPKGHSFQLCYGHNTWRAAQLAEVEDLLIDVRPFTDDKMLEMMAYENKGDSHGNMMVILETVKQTGDYLRDSIADIGDFKAYKKAGGSFFTKKAAFDNAKTQGIGFKTILKMLEGWSSGDVQNAHRVLGDLEAEYYDQDMVSGMPSVAVLGQFSLLAKALREQTWPEYFKDTMVVEASDLICDPDVSTTTKILKNAISALKDGKNPVKYIKSTQRVDFNVAKATKDLVFENTAMDISLKDLPDLDGFKDYEELDDLVKKVGTSIKRTLAARDDGKTDEEIAEDEDKDLAPEGVEAAVDATEDETAPAELPDLPPIEAADDDDVEMPITALVEHFIRGVNYLTPLSAKLLERATETAEEADFLEAVEDLFKAATGLMVENFDSDDARSVLDTVIEGL